MQHDYREQDQEHQLQQSNPANATFQIHAYDKSTTSQDVLNNIEAMSHHARHSTGCSGLPASAEFAVFDASLTCQC